MTVINSNMNAPTCLGELAQDIEREPAERPIITLLTRSLTLEGMNAIRKATVHRLLAAAVELDK